MYINLADGAGVAVGAIHTVRSNFISLTLSPDVLQLKSSGTHNRELAISVIAAEVSLFSAANSATFQWQSAPNSNGTYTAIASATSSVYNAPSALTHNRFYRAVWEYNYLRNYGANRVARVTITFTHALAEPVEPVLSLVLPTALNQSATVAIASGNSAISGTPTYQWQSAITEDGTYLDIQNQVGTTYEINNSYNYTRVFLRVKLIYTHNGEQIEAFAYSPVMKVTLQPQLLLPLFDITLDGVTASVSVAANADVIAPSPAATYQWQNANAQNGTYNNIANATAKTFDISAYNYNRPYLRVSVSYTHTGAGVGATSATSPPIFLPFSPQPTIEQQGKTVRLVGSGFPAGALDKSSALLFTYTETPSSGGTACSAITTTASDNEACLIRTSYDTGTDTSTGLFIFSDDYFLRSQYPIPQTDVGDTLRLDFNDMGFQESAEDARPRRYVRMITEYKLVANGQTFSVTSAAYISLTLALDDIARLNLAGNVLSVSVASALSDRLRVGVAPANPYIWQRSTTNIRTFVGITNSNSPTYTITSFGDDQYYRIQMRYSVMFASRRSGSDGNYRQTIAAIRRAPQFAEVAISVSGQVASVTIVANSLVVTNPTYQWQDSATPGGTYANVASADNKTYDFSSHSASRPYLRVSVSYTHTDAGVGTTNAISPIIPTNPPPAPVIAQNGRKISIASNGFPAEAIDKSSILGYSYTDSPSPVQAGTALEGKCVGILDVPNCRPVLSLYATGTDAATGLFILPDSYFLRPIAIGDNLGAAGEIQNDQPDLGFWPGLDRGIQTIRPKNHVRMYLTYKYIQGGATYTLESNFVILTLAPDAVQLIGGGANNRALSISVLASQVSLFSVANNAAAFQWQSAPSANGTYTDIASANSSVYAAPSALTNNRFYRAIWEYNYLRIFNGENRAGRVSITLSHEVAAPAVPVLRVVLPSSGLGDATADFVSGENLISSTPPPVYQWQNATAIDSTFEDITGATGTTYEITDSYSSTRSYLRVKLTYTHGPENAAAQIVYSPALAAIRLPQLSITIRAAQASVSVVANDNVISGSPAAVYQWQNATAIDGTFADILNATGMTYDVPATYASPPRPYLRMRLSYTHTDAAIGARNAVSPPIRVAGVESGTISFALNGAPAVGGVATVNVSEMVDILGLAVLTQNLTYQWYNGDGTDWNTIDTNGDGASYTIVATDFDNTNRQLSLQVEDPAGLGGPYNPSPIDLQRDTTGNLVIDASPLSVGATITANTSGLIDENGEGTYTYAWYYVRDGGTPEVISGASDNTLVIGSVPNGNVALSVIVSVTHTDALGFESVLSGVERALTDSASSGALAVASESVRAGGQLTADVSRIADNNGIGTYTYQWQRWPASGSGWEDISSATDATYTLPASNWNARPSVRVSVVHTDGLRYLFTITSPPFAINQNPNGTPQLEVVNNVTPIAGTTVRAVTTGITDSNNENTAGTGGAFTYEWQESSGTAKGGQTSRDYILTADDVTAINNGTPPQVKVTYTDELGFVRVWTVRVHVVEARITRTNAQLVAALADPGNRVQANTDSYTWLQSATENGTYAAIVPSATGKNYTVPADYGTSHPFVRVSVTYTDAGAAANVVSNPIRVAGVQSGTVGITDPAANVGVGDVVNSDITNLTSILDRAVLAADLTYQWYSGDGTNTNWTAINTNGTGVSYTIVATDFTNTRRQLSLRVTDPTGLSGPFNSQAIDLQRNTSGNVVIDASRLSVGATITANTSGLRDDNGKGTNAYAWYYMRDGGTPQEISGKTNATLVIDNADLPSGNAALSVIVSITHTDLLGFETVLSGVETALTDSNSSGALAINSNSVRAGGALTANVSRITDANGIGAYAYQWQQQNTGGGAWTDISSGSNINIYTLPTSNWNGVPMLRVSVVHTDGLGYLFTITSSLLVINQEPTGAPKVEVVNNVTPVTGTTVRAVTVGITDTNNENTDRTGGTFAYEWQESDGTAKSSATGVSYTLTAPDVTAINAGSAPPQVEVTYTDDLGFVRVWTVKVHVVEARITRNGVQLDAALNDPGTVVLANSARYQWQQSATENGNYTAISGVGNVASYTVPVSYGTTHPFVRVSISYTDKSASPNVVTNAVSSSERVAGVASGTVGITPPTNVGVGGVVNSDISDLVNVLGIAVRAEDLTYQWYNGDGSTWTAIASNGTGASYTIAAADFTNDNRQLSLQVTDPAGLLTAPLGANAVNLQRAAVGDVAINLSAPAIGANAVANVSNINDANGEGAYTYAWYFARGSDTPQQISSANSGTYVITKTDVPNGSAELHLLVSVTHTDALGFAEVSQLVSVTLTNSASSGAPAVVSESVRAGGALTANVDSISDENGKGAYTYQWQRWPASGSGWEDIGSATGVTYTLPASGWDARPSVRVSVVHTDDLGYTANLVSPPFAINREPTGEPFVMLVVGGAPAAGKVARVVTSGVTDTNNGTGQGNYSYQWQNSDDSNKSGETNGDYILTAPDVTAIGEGNLPKVLVTLTDSLGFVFDWTVEVRVVDVRVSRNGAIFTAELSDSGNAVRRDSDSYQWLQSAREDGTYAAIVPSATGKTYTVPVGYGTSHPFVRVSVSYTDKSSGSDVAANVVSSPQRVAGVASGTVSFALVGAPAVGGVATVNVSGMQDILGRTVLTQNLTYQWYKGDGGSSWAVITPNGTGSSYTIAAADFDNDNRQLSLRVEDPAGMGGPFNPSAINLQRDTTGNVAINASRLSVGATITANTNGLSDANGKGTYTYAWYYVRIGGTPELISGASDNTLVIDSVADLPNGNAALSVIVSVTHTDALGFESVLATVESALTDSASSGALAIDSNSVRAGGKLTANVSGITDKTASALMLINGNNKIRVVLGRISVAVAILIFILYPRVIGMVCRCCGYRLCIPMVWVISLRSLRRCW